MIHPTDHMSTVRERRLIRSTWRSNHASLHTSRCIILKAEHNLRRPVPPRRDIFGHEPGIGGVGEGGIAFETPGETEVANFEFTVGVDEEVSRFEVPVEDGGGVDVLMER